MITVVGLGNEKGDLTERGKTAILNAKKVVVRTAETESYQSVLALGVEHVTLDGVYKTCRSFKTLHKKLADEVIKYGDGAVYLVDGSATEDNSVRVLMKKQRKNIEVIDGVSKVSAIVKSADFAECSYTAVSAYEADGRSTYTYPLVVFDLDDKSLASDVKLWLSEQIGEETYVKFIRRGKARKIPLYELDRQKQYDYTTAVAVEKKGLLEKARYTLDDLKEIIVDLRKPDGCPWDKVQTPESIKMNAVEEAYELVDAIDSQDDEKVLEETGDLLMQVVFHAVMKEETGAFTLSDVLFALCDKLITRHTHVFGKDKAKNATEALAVWDKNKMKEKNQDTYAKAVNDVPKCFPALLQAQKVAKRVETGGWDKSTFENASVKLNEELAELKKAYEKGNKAEISAELGDLLMCTAWLARAVGADAEESLLDAVKKVKRRYTAYENAVIKDGKDVLTLSKKERDEYYLAVKKAEKEGGERN